MYLALSTSFIHSWKAMDTGCWGLKPFYLLPPIPFPTPWLPLPQQLLYAESLGSFPALCSLLDIRLLCPFLTFYLNIWALWYQKLNREQGAGVCQRHFQWRKLEAENNDLGEPQLRTCDLWFLGVYVGGKAQVGVRGEIGRERQEERERQRGKGVIYR